ncbi:hypothetical protein ACFDR9_000014 [Janthinobacterium sp. CG_23.3]|nr:hypothetical protein [Janthinobacterium sp. CG_S6]
MPLNWRAGNAENQPKTESRGRALRSDPGVTQLVLMNSTLKPPRAAVSSSRSHQRLGQICSWTRRQRCPVKTDSSFTNCSLIGQFQNPNARFPKPHGMSNVQSTMLRLVWQAGQAIEHSASSENHAPTASLQGRSSGSYAAAQPGQRIAAMPLSPVWYTVRSIATSSPLIKNGGVRGQASHCAADAPRAIRSAPLYACWGHSVVEMTSRAISHSLTRSANACAWSKVASKSTIQSTLAPIFSFQEKPYLKST